MTEPDERDVKVVEDETLTKIAEEKLDQGAGDVLRVLLVIAARLGRIEDAHMATYSVVDERIPGDLDSNVDKIVEIVSGLDPYGDLNELVRRRLLGHPPP